MLKKTKFFDNPTSITAFNFLLFLREAHELNAGRDSAAAQHITVHLRDMTCPVTAAVGTKEQIYNFWFSFLPSCSRDKKGKTHGL